MRLDYEALETTPVSDTPFPHIVVENFVPAVDLAAVVSDLPAILRGGSFPTASVSLGPAAAKLIEAIEGMQLRDVIAKKFGLDLHEAPTMVTLRGQARARDGQIHRDSEAKRVTVLLYLNPLTEDWARQEGCLRLLRGPDNLEDYAVEVSPVDGTLLAFPNGPTTWHGHRSFAGRRYVVQLNYMTASAKARSELRRHKFSAFIKRLTAT